MTSQEPTSARSTNRRDFLKTSLAAGAAAAGGLSLARTAHAAGSDVIRIGLIGCGHRGPGAANDAMTADPGVRLVAMTDIFADHVRDRRERLRREKPDQVQVDDAHCFSGLEGYKHVIDAADVVLVACAAKYHPVYLQAAVEAGKHVFVEKPHAVDPVGRAPGRGGLQAGEGKGIERHVGPPQPLRPRLPGDRSAASTTAPSARSWPSRRTSSAARITSSSVIPS